MPPFQLRAVALALRQHPQVAALPHIGCTISNFLGPSSNLSLTDACKFGSITLLDWMWDSSAPSQDARTPGWTLCNFLRSEPLYYQWQFHKATQIATGRGDVKTLEWLFTHFTGCEVPSEAVTNAAAGGHIPVLEFMLNNDAGWNFNREIVQMSYGEGGEDSWFESVPDLPDDWSGPGNVVRWGGQSLDAAVRNGHYETARWLQEYTPYDSTEEELDEIIAIAANDGAIEFAESLKPKNCDLLEYVNERAKPKTIEWLLEKGYVKKNQDLGAMAIVVAAVHGDLDLMQRVARHRNKRRKITQWPREWKFSIGLACSRGNYEMVKWMVEHPLGPDAIAGMKDNCTFDMLLDDAATTGNVELVDLLFDLGSDDLYGSALLKAATGGHLKCVNRLLERCSTSMYLNRESIEKVVVEAAKNNHLNTLEFFHYQDAPRMHPCTNRETSKRRRIEPTNIWWSKASAAFDAAAANGHLKVLKWLHANRYKGCSTDAMDHAAGNGHLNVLKWLHANVKEATCTERAMDTAATHGHLNVVKWLHANTDASCTVRAMDRAAGYGRFRVLKWLHANRTEGCTYRAFNSAVSYGHLKIAYYLRSKLPKLTPPDNQFWFRSLNQFDVLLFLRENCPEIFTVEFGRETKCDFSGDSARPGDFLIEEWLDELYPEVGQEEEE